MFATHMITLEQIEDLSAKPLGQTLQFFQAKQSKKSLRFTNADFAGSDET
jgi:hypothetical protein